MCTWVCSEHEARSVPNTCIKTNSGFIALIDAHRAARRTSAPHDQTTQQTFVALEMRASLSFVVVDVVNAGYVYVCLSLAEPDRLSCVTRAGVLTCNDAATRERRRLSIMVAFSCVRLCGCCVAPLVRFTEPPSPPQHVSAVSHSHHYPTARTPQSRGAAYWSIHTQLIHKQCFIECAAPMLCYARSRVRDVRAMFCVKKSHICE